MASVCQEGSIKDEGRYITGPQVGDKTRKAVTSVGTCSFNDVWGKGIY